MMEWQPIETAPLRKPILVAGGEPWGEVDHPTGVGVAVVEQTNPGYYTLIGTSYYSAGVNDPTHWMPLPDPPTSPAAQAT
jgi:hypothetical protein